MAAPTKEYGLFMRNANKSSVQPKLAIFDEDSDDDGHTAVGKSLQKEAQRIQAKKQLKLNLNSALEEDPTVFEYDEIYDDITQKKQEQTGWQKRNKEKTPKYIHSLMKAAKTRKLEQERALERKVQKEREAEGEEFAGKEAFVTSAYKKKMQEMEELEEKERQEARIEALTDVTKQKDLSGFYRQLYKHTLGAEEKSVSNLPELPKEKKSSSDSQNDDGGESSSKNSRNRDESPKQFKDRKPRQFRRRKDSTDGSSESDGGRRSHKEAHRSSSDSSPVTRGRSPSQEKVKPNKSRTSRKSSSNSSMESPVRSNYSRTSHSSFDRTVKHRHKDRSSRKRSPSNSSDERHSKRRHQRRERSPIKRHSHSSDKREAHGCLKESSEHKEIKRNRDPSSQKTESHKKTESHQSSSSDKKSVQVEATENEKTAEETRREKLIVLFRKRNVGEAFEQARERYLARKDARQAALLASG